MTNNLPQTNSLTLALEPRMMFDAAAAATVSEVAAQADAANDVAVQAADHSPVNAAASDTKITVDKTGQATSADLFKDVSVSDIADGKTYDAVTIKVSGVEAGSLVINGDSLKLSHGQSLTLKGGDYDGLRADVVRNDDGSFTVTVQITGLDKGEVAGLIDGLKLNVDGTQQTSEQVTVTLESISYMNESEADAVDISTTISVTSRFNFAPEIDSSSDLSVADQITAAGIGTGSDIVSSADGSTAFVRDADGKISAFQVVDGKLKEVGSLDTSKIDGFGSLKSMVVSGKGDRLFLCDNNNIYVVSFDGEKQALTCYTTRYSTHQTT